MLPRGRIATDLAVGIIGAADIDRSAGEVAHKEFLFALRSC
jgi:hypothetical protein